MHMNWNCSGPGKAWKLAALAAMARAGSRGGWMGGPFGAFGEEGPFGKGGPRRRGRRGPFERDELRLLLLRLLADQPRHGYDLIKLLEERSGGQYAPSPGVIYPALAMLADEGLIAEQPGEDQRRRYALTEAGRAALAAEAGRAEALLASLDQIADRADRARKPQIERAAANLFMAVGQRLAQGGKDGLVHEIAEILDEAARRVERL